MVKCQCFPPEKDGFHFNSFVAQYFSECLYTPLEIASFYVGMSSLVFWCCCQLPQFYKNYKRKSGAGLSKCFLIEWFSGDILNLTGALLTRQLPTQIATGVLFIFVDFFLLCQVFYYGTPQKKTKTKDNSLTISFLDLNNTGQAVVEENEEFLPPPLPETENQPRTLTINSRGEKLAGMFFPFFLFSFLGSNEQQQFINTLQQNATLPDCAPEATVTPFVSHVGYILGWISAAVYLNSRIPQVLKNYKRKSVEGLSKIMFFCAVMGNTTYGLGVLLKDASPTALKKSMPWLVGSLGTVMFDFFIMLQFSFYADTTKKRRQKRRDYSYQALDGTEDLEERDVAMPDTPIRGLFGLKSWTNSPFTGPQDHGYTVLEPSRQSLLRKQNTVGNIESSDEEEDLERARADSL